MARYFYVFTLNTEEQLDLFYTQDGVLDLEQVAEQMRENSVPISEGGIIAGEGYHNVEILSLGDDFVIQAYCLTHGSLGYFNEAKLSSNAFITERKQHSYFTKSKVYITNNNLAVIMFDNSIEERSKVSVKGQIELLGFETTRFKINDTLIRAIQNKYNWSAATFNKIIKHGDSTKKVSFEIDPANDTDTSQIDEQYREHAEMAHIKFEVPFTEPGTPNFVTVTVYSNGNRIIINEEEFTDEDSLKRFMFILINELKQLV